MNDRSKPQTKTALSVVIPCYNTASTISAQLEALAGQRWSNSWEIIVSDNGSTDDTLQVVEHYRERLPSLRIVEAFTRKGSAHALNVGSRAALGESLAFCDADDIVGAEWVAAMGDALSRYSFVAGRFETQKLNPAWVQKSRANPQASGLPRYRYPPYLSYAGGGNMGVKRALYDAIGGFDESLLLLHDTDFCWRLQLAGTELRFVPDAVLHVRYRSTLRGIYHQARGYAEYNVILYKRYLPLGMPLLSRKESLTHGADSLQSLLRLFLGVRTKADLARWIWQLGWWIGRLQGSVKERVYAL